MSRLLVRNGVFASQPFAGGLGEETPASAAEVKATADLAVLDERTKEIIRRLEEDAKNRKYALIIGAASALFAAVKLGLVAFQPLRARGDKL